MIRSAFLSCAILALANASALAMCGSSAAVQAGAPSKQSEKHQCMPMTDGAGMDTKAEGKGGEAADPHAGMDMSPKGKDGGMQMGCGCCKGAMNPEGGKGGGMCGGKQASLVTEDGKNDPLLTDPMWHSGKKPDSKEAPAGH